MRTWTVLLIAFLSVLFCGAFVFFVYHQKFVAAKEAAYAGEELAMVEREAQEKKKELSKEEMDEVKERLKELGDSFPSREENPQEVKKKKTVEQRLLDLEERVKIIEQDIEELYGENLERTQSTRRYINSALDRLEREIRQLKGPEFKTVADLKKDLEKHGVTLDEKAGTVTVKGSVCLQKDLVEFFAVTNRGSTHESVLVLDCLPSSLNAALIALGFEKGKPAWAEEKKGEKPPKDPREDTRVLTHAPQGTRVYILVEWEAEGKTVRKWGEDLVLDSSTGKTVGRGGWVYIGSRMERDIRTGRPFFVADIMGNIISTWFNYSNNSVLTLASKEGASDDFLYANHRILPPAGTPVTVTFSKNPPKED